ncbi:MAG: bifunctional 4-hydroxy-3-methylbut-2-enyl diphosphate reductase/30S ribosomal protein S1 [Clostridiales bacterium]|nr:bifunctional 4-hydroxy-3-methylbut-2-enyl diphosphate reductase/30S ribosomal protein S1 [Clostridiales bacterium]MDD7035528.1 bifunctional 4-hydroxy-3-methylbut-2-enyl diphosphate reductase/30S ribosomal protein S1 [Bacillota bacterium]MDY2919888.1 bifunctional 4-hydroxy-3-methylbut-2-enyl diphosphate reductase/30S ribosomal protein S1 [Lentihominibacter sp.]
MKENCKEIIRAENSGFCFGVRRAVEVAENAAGGEERVFTLGPLIHNETVTEDLKRKGVTAVSSPDEALEAGGEEKVRLIIRSHGEGRSVYERCESLGINITDATCPFVDKIHRLVACEERRRVLIIGDRNHPEVRGIAGWCRREALIVSGGNEMKALLDEMGAEYFREGLLAVTQTTLKNETVEEVERELAGMDYVLHNTICHATEERQKACAELAGECDAMVVIGGKNSSNSRKLYEIAQKYCPHSVFVSNIEDLPLHHLEKYNKIGVAAGASTPECTIKEVIASMSEVTLEKELTMDDLMEDIDKSLRLPRNGEVVTGKVHQVNDGEVIVNLGCKKDGILPINEVSLEEGQTLADVFKVDDEVQAKVIKTDDVDGGILLSKKKLEISANWGEIVKALEDKTVLEVKVTRTVNGGVIAEYKEVYGFIPLSQLSDHYVENAEEFVGQTMEVRVSRVDQRRNRAVFSHKMFLNEEREKLIAEIWEKLNVGDIVEGTVMRFTDYGAFVDIGGIDGLLHISEISWGKLKHPQEVLSIGDKINVKVLSMNAEKGKISLGLKQTTPEPWSIIDEKYEVGQVIEGRILQIKEYGAFVELEPGLDGLVHISEVAHKRVGNIADELSVGQVVKAKILEIDKDRKRISLSIRETLDPAAEEQAAPEAEAEAEEATEE